MTYVRIGSRDTIDKDPADSLMYGVSFEGVMIPGDTLASGTATATGLTVGTATVDADDEGDAATGTAAVVLKARISGGTAGLTIPVEFTAVTASGDTIQRSIWLRIVQR